MTEDDIRLAMELFGDAGYNDPLSQYNRSREIPKPAPKRKSALDAARFPTLGRGTQPQIGLEPEFRDIDLKQREATIAGLSPLENLQAFGEGARTVGQAAVAGITQPFAELMGVPADKFYKAAIDLPETAGGIARGEQMIEGVEDFFGAMSESPLAPIVEKIPFSPYSPASAQAIDTGLAQAGKGLKMAGQQAKQAGRQTLEAGKDLAQAARAEFATPPTGAVQLQTQQAQRNPLGMYSQAEQVALNLPQQKGTGNQFLAQISKTPGVKPAELEWTGLADFLKSKGDKPVTKAEIQQHLDANRVQVEEVTLGRNPRAIDDPEIADDVAMLRSAGYEPDINPDNPTMFGFVSEDGDILDANEIASIFSEPNSRIANAAQRVQDFVDAEKATTKYGKWQLPGGSNYREVLLTLPKKPQTIKQLSDGSWFAQGPSGSEGFYGKTREEAIERFQKGRGSSADFQSTHFNQPNILAHMRLNDRVDANGDKVLFVEEIQSDWGQQGREKGFAGDLDKQLPEVLKKTREAQRNTGDVFDRLIATGLSEQQVNSHPEFIKAYEQERAIKQKYGELTLRSKSNIPSAPFVQNTEDWVNLSLKRLITDAVNNGYKKVAFINGEQSADRYNLSKYINAVTFTQPNKDGRMVVQAFDKRDNRVMSGKYTVQEVEDRYGKELTQKMLSSTGAKDPRTGMQSLSGVDLKVGGEGMKKFYDQIVPATANKLLKKLGGGKLEPVKIGDNEQLGFTITPEMVELVKKQGLPMFAGGGAVTMAKGGEAELDNYALAEAEMQQEIEDALAYEKLNRLLRETEAKLREGLITPEEAVPLMGGLNAYEIARLYGLPTDDYVRPQLSSDNPEQHYDLMLSPEKLSDMARRHRDYDRRMKQHEYGPNSEEVEVNLAIGGGAFKGMKQGLQRAAKGPGKTEDPAKKAMKAQRREERVQKNLEAYMGSKEKPKTYYHATQAPEDFEAFDLEKRPDKRSAAAVFLTPSTDWANDWGALEMADMDLLNKVDSPKPRIMPLITRVKNTFDYENPEHVAQVMNKAYIPSRLEGQRIAEEIAGGNWNFIEDRNIQKAIKAAGFDSFNVKEKGVKNLGVFNPADVKALFNRGSYDPTTSDISKAGGGMISADDIRQKLKNAFNFAGGGKVKPKPEEPKIAGGGMASMSLLERLRAYKKGGEVRMAIGGDAAKRVKAGFAAAKKGMKAKAQEDKKPAYSEKVLQSTTERMAAQIQKENPKMSAEDVLKKAQTQAKKKLTWEREEKPELEKTYGELKKAPYSASLPERKQNVPAVVQQRIEETERFLAQPTEPWEPPRKELQAFDRERIKDALEGFPGVEQTRFPRYQAPRSGALGMMQEIYQDPVNRRLIEGQIKRGLPLGGETFYASLYPLKLAALERGIPEQQFNQFVYSIAPASARNSIMNEMAVGQFLRDMNARGLPLDEETVRKEMDRFKAQYGTGLPLMPVHREGVKNVLEGNLDLREMSKADIPTNYKIPTYGTQKAGDFAQSMVLDVHEAAGQTRGSKYHPYFTEQGGFSQPEYGPAESEMLDIAQGLGIPGGMAQAGRWFGGGELTGLKSPRGDALDLLERQAAYTLQGQGINPTPRAIRNFVLDMVETGRGELMPYFKKTPMPDYRTEKKKGGLATLKG